MIPLSALCISRQHCTTCRSLNHGRAWRDGVLLHYQADGVDFDCPEGMPWTEDVVSGNGPHPPAAMLAGSNFGCGGCGQTPDPL